MPEGLESVDCAIEILWGVEYCRRLRVSARRGWIKLSELHESTNALVTTPLMVTSVLDLSKVDGVVEEGTAANVGYTVAVALPSSRWSANLGEVPFLLAPFAGGVPSWTFVTGMLTVPTKVALGSCDSRYRALRVVLGLARMR